MPQSDDNGRPADVEISARVSAESLRFEGRPEVSVRVAGDHRIDGEPPAKARSSSGSERENLPEPVEADVTYRDAKVRWHARGWLTETPREND
jgi:hypothetical protein